MLNTLNTRGKERRWYSLIDKVYSPANLQAAYERVKRNNGAPGIDRISVSRYGQSLEHYQATLQRELQTSSYRPKPVKRVYIDKLGSCEKRPLGIPSLRDRIAQTALKHVLEPIFEQSFASCSYGFRPGRSCRDALRVVEKLLLQGYVHIVDADITSYFDQIDHTILMDEVRSLIADGAVLNLIELYLKQGIMEGLRYWEPESGSPQGAVISPLLANLYLNPLDHLLQERGIQIVRYADDFVLLCRRAEEAEAALTLVRDWMAAHKLQLHPTKTQVVDMATVGSQFTFLGYKFLRHTNKRGVTKLLRAVAPKSLRKIKSTIRDKTPRKHGNSLEVIIADLNRSLRGWFGYFQYAKANDHSALDGYVRRRLRRLLRKRTKRHRGTGRACSDHRRWPNQFFADHGYFSLAVARASVVQSLRGTR